MIPDENLVTILFDVSFVAYFPALFGVGIAAGIALRLIPWAVGRVADSVLLITDVQVTPSGD